ncbi:MAG: hypothetical protein MK035_08975 [Dehalococcoidia bacterium]|nr:hypothetical protein [Dehalococcoidia bacterium]
MAETNIKFEKIDGVGIITMDRPESRNSLTPEMVEEMGDLLYHAFVLMVANEINLEDVWSVLQDRRSG